MRTDNEQMPRSTLGRWAWGLLVHGKPFPSPDRMAAAAEAKQKKQEEEDKKANPEANVANEEKPPTGESAQQVNVAAQEVQTSTAPAPPAQAADDVVMRPASPIASTSAPSTLNGVAVQHDAPIQPTHEAPKETPPAAPKQSSPPKAVANGVVPETPQKGSISQNAICVDESDSELSELSDSETSTDRVPPAPKLSEEEIFVQEQEPCWQTVNWPFCELKLASQE
mgnify:CR=1 FL=1